MRSTEKERTGRGKFATWWQKHFPASLHFYEISVAQSHQRRGAGTAMIRLLKQFCKQQKVMKMWVSTNRSNVMAMGLYQSTGGQADSSGDEISFLY